MKLLLDENLPHKIRTLLPGHECLTVRYMGWSGIENGELLRVAQAAGFDALVTNDRGLEYEQNPKALPLAVLILISKDNKRATLEGLVPKLTEALSALVPRSLMRVEADG